MKIPYVRELGLLSAPLGNSLPFHTNDGFEIVYVFAGRYRWELEGGLILTVHGGQISLTFPNEPHRGYLDHMTPGKILYIVFDLDQRFINRYNTGSQSGLAQLRSQLMACTSRTHTVPADGRSAAESLAEQIIRLFDKAGSEAIDHAILQQEVDRFILYSIRSVLHQGEEKKNPLEPLQIFIEDHLSGPLPLDRLEGVSGWSRTQLYHLFHKHIGQSPNDYIQSRRCDAACSLLEQTKISITDIAIELGYSSSQYFSRVFKKYIGMTPSEYRKLRTTGNTNIAHN